ncbi:FtsX-like permease family protein, partial [Microbacterium sp. ZW T5_56]|uniref:FtsX-like permease family protein n=1 Tax=Microbacterium sp. ZW T5_56 TaxID=3378081 RepID=UPI0038540059
PALVALIEANPADRLADRYGTFAGQIPAELLPSPDTLAVVVGATPESVAMMRSALAVMPFDGQTFGGNENYQALAVVGAIALLMPAFLLVSVATSLGAAARSERNQTLRTIGASGRFLVRTAAVEAGLSAAIGAIAGIGLFFATRPLLTLLRVAGERLTLEDLTVSVGALALVALVVIVGSMIAATWSATRSGAQATTTQAVFERAPRVWRVIPFLAGLLALIGVRVAGSALPIPTTISVIACFAVLAVGIVIAGPYLTYLTGRVYAATATSGAGVLASQRILRTPAAVFRSVAGLVAATFLVSLFATAVTARADADSFGSDVLLPPDAVAVEFNPAGEHPVDEAVLADTLSAARNASGVRDVIVAHGNVDGTFLTSDEAQRLGTKAIPDSSVLSVVGGLFSLAPETAALTSTDLADVTGLPVAAVIIRTDGTAAAIERARTILLDLPDVDPAAGAWTRGEFVSSADTNLAIQFAEIGRFAIVIATMLAASVLVMATIAALYDRRRTLALLRLIGMPTSTLRGVITRETLVPLIGVTIISAGAGYLTAWLLITSLSADRTVGWPDPLMPIALIATAVMAAVAIWIATAAGRRLLRREQVRYE